MPWALQKELVSLPGKAYIPIGAYRKGPKAFREPITCKISSGENVPLGASLAETLWHGRMVINKSIER